ncbi:UNVERIFIED_CONTAM: hypothetical protein K2H54_015863 [Gekko kuhli]
MLEKTPNVKTDFVVPWGTGQMGGRRKQRLPDEGVCDRALPDSNLSRRSVLWLGLYWKHFCNPSAPPKIYVTWKGVVPVPGRFCTFHRTVPVNARSQNLFEFLVLENSFSGVPLSLSFMPQSQFVYRTPKSS